MELLRDLLAVDPSRPRLTFYDEPHGVRLEFSATTLANWANKTAGWLINDCDFDEVYEQSYPSNQDEPNGRIALASGNNWQSIGLALGALTVGSHFDVDITDRADIILCDLARAQDYFDQSLDPITGEEAEDAPNIAIVTDDPFGRGVKEIGEELPDFAIDFGPEVRINDDTYHYPCPSIEDALSTLTGRHIEQAPHHKRLLSHGWSSTEDFIENILVPIAQGHTVVVVHGPVSGERLRRIATEERITDPAFV
ncbi:MAG: TIGR03089 family protein [Corynebacterium sp.]|nr:TIGR03089 family protein [Corynebacterium sp.]